MSWRLKKVAKPPCPDNAQKQLRCWVCAVYGRCTPDEVAEALNKLGAFDEAESYTTRLLRIERSQVVSQLLEVMSEPQRLSLTEDETEREQRLLKRTCDLKFMSWFDGSPNLNRSWVTHYIMLHYDSLRMRLSAEAQVACRRMCSNLSARPSVQPSIYTAIGTRTSTCWCHGGSNSISPWPLAVNGRRIFARSTMRSRCRG